MSPSVKSYSSTSLALFVVNGGNGAMKISATDAKIFAKQ